MRNSCICNKIVTYRQKFHSVESEASKGTEVFRDKLGSIKGKVQGALEEASKSDIAKKAG